MRGLRIWVFEMTSMEASLSTLLSIFVRGERKKKKKKIFQIFQKAKSWRKKQRYPNRACVNNDEFLKEFDDHSANSLVGRRNELQDFIFHLDSGFPKFLLLSNRLLARPNNTTWKLIFSVAGTSFQVTEWTHRCTNTTGKMFVKLMITFFTTTTLSSLSILWDVATNSKKSAHQKKKKTPSFLSAPQWKDEGEDR